MLIDQLPLRNSPEDTDELPIEAGTTTYKTTIAKLLSNVVRKAGDTMTNTLTILGYNFTAKSGALEVGNPPNTDSNAVGVIMQDKNGKQVSSARPRFLTSGGIELRLTGTNYVGDSAYNNALGLGVNDDGTRYIYVSAKKPWAEGLGYLPVTVSPTIVAELPSGFTAATVACVRSGYIVQVQFSFTVSSSPGTSFKTVATGLPAAALNSVYTIAYNNSAAGWPLRLQVTTGGNLQAARGVAGQSYNGSIIYIASSGITL